MTTDPDANLQDRLERITKTFDVADRLDHDPLGVVREYPREEQEVVAHIVAPLAYGNAVLIRAACRRVLAAMAPSPTQFVANAKLGDFHERLPDFVYRMSKASDVDALVAGLGALLRAHGTLEEAYIAARAVDPTGPPAGLNMYVERLRKAATGSSTGSRDKGTRGGFGGTLARGARFLMPDPRTGSASKRWHLMLRWLVRPDDGMDLGLWTAIEPRELLIPLDTHVSRLARSLGLTQRRTVDRKMAIEVTKHLAAMDPDDPMRFDMPLCHLGMSKACQHRYLAETCGPCALRDVCVIAGR